MMEINWLTDNMAALEVRLNGGSAGPLHVLRRQALDRLFSKGFPTNKQERWRFIDISAAAQGPWKAAVEIRTDPASIKYWLDLTGGALRLVFINGHYVKELSRLPQEVGINVKPLSQALVQPGWRDYYFSEQGRAWQDNPFVDLNLAFVEEGAVIEVPAGRVLENPVYVIHYASPGENVIVHPHHLLVAGDRSRVRFVEIYAGREGERYFVNPVTRLDLGAESRVEHYRLQRESTQALHIGVTAIHQLEKSQYIGHAIDFGGSLVRNDVSVELDGEGSEAYLGGLYVLEGKQHLDNHTTLHHQKQRTYSRQLYKGVLLGKSHAVFNGRIRVAREAQHTDAIQHNKNLLLSDQAAVDTQPQLEIYADDVRCTHGGTIGQLNEEGIFYLRSRGLAEESARQLMVQAFVGEMFGGMKTENMRLEIERFAMERLGWEEQMPA